PPSPPYRRATGPRWGPYGWHRSNRSASKAEEFFVGAPCIHTEPRPTGRGGARARPVQFTSTTVPVVIATSSEKSVGKIVRGVPPAAHNCGYSCKVRSTTVSTGAG